MGFYRLSLVMASDGDWYCFGLDRVPQSEVAEACVGMARLLGLALSGVDLRRTPDDQYYCFEVNPSPGFVFYERATGQPISEAVAHLLRGGKQPSF